MIFDERRQEKIQCKICGRWCIAVGIHVHHKHHVTARQYKKEFGYNVSQGLLPEWFKKHMASAVTEKTLANLTRRKPLKKGSRGVSWSQEEREKRKDFKHSEKTKKAIGRATHDRRYTSPPEFDVDKLTCQICGTKTCTLNAHVRLIHKMTQTEYKTRFGLPLETGLIPNWKRRKRNAKKP